MDERDQRPILLFSEGISYCHVVRPLVIGRWLKELGQPILVACPQKHEETFRQGGFRTIPIETADPGKIYARLAKGKTLYTTAELLAYYEQDEALLKAVQPRLVVADFRFPLLQLAKRDGIPSVGITSASCHPNFPLDGTTPNPFIWPSFLPAEFFDFMQRTFVGALTRKLLVNDLSRPYRQASRKYGLPLLPTFFDYASQGDLCLLSDHPDVMPLPKLRPQDMYTGALIWERDEPLPPELKGLPADLKKIYITVGTQDSMSLDFLDDLLVGLLKHNFVVIVSKGKRQFDVGIQNERLFVFDFLNESKLLPLMDLYIYHGSAMSTYHGLYYGIPMISIPQQADQHFHSEAVVRLGAGTLFRPIHLRGTELVRAALELLHPISRSAASKSASNVLRSYDPQSHIIDRVSSLGQNLAQRLTA